MIIVDTNYIKNLKSQNPEIYEAFDSLSKEHSMTLKKISHEFGNALTLINSSLQIIESSHPEVKSFKYWDTTMEDIAYLKTLISQISQFNNSELLSLSIIQPAMILKDIITTFSSYDDVINKNISIKFESDSPVPDITGDYIKLKQVFINLIKNSIEACNENASIKIRTYIKHSFLCIDISDTGCGMSDLQLENIFSPMVTYKPGGTGLGLPICKRIIEAHNGSISVMSLQEQGTTFTIVLPL